MDPVVAVLQRPEILWPDFIAGCQQLLGRSPTRSLDQASIRPGLPASLVQALGEFQHEDTAPLPYIKSREVDAALVHLSFSFLVACDKQTITELLKLGRLNILCAEDGDVAVVSANLRDWRDVIIQGCHPKASRSLRLLINRLQHSFSIHGLAFLWHDHVRQTTNDGTVALVQRGTRTAP